MGNRGFCRSSCKKSEQAYFYCRTFQMCCLQSYVRISLTGVDDNTNWSYEKHWPRIPWQPAHRVQTSREAVPAVCPLIKMYASDNACSFFFHWRYIRRLGFARWEVCPILDAALWEKGLGSWVTFREEPDQALEVGECGGDQGGELRISNELWLPMLCRTQGGTRAGGMGQSCSLEDIVG